MSKIQDEAYTEAMEEIARLKAEIRKLETLWFSEYYRVKNLLLKAVEELDS